MPHDRYRKYEQRTPMPAYLMERFALVCDATVENLLLGTPRGRSEPFVVSDQERDLQKRKA